jgi:hypothetical protein
MGTFAETAIVDYRSSFAYQGKKTSGFRFRVQLQMGVLPFPCSKRTKVAFSVNSVLCLQ